MISSSETRTSRSSARRRAAPSATPAVAGQHGSDATRRVPAGPRSTSRRRRRPRPSIARCTSLSWPRLLITMTGMAAVRGSCLRCSITWKPCIFGMIRSQRIAVGQVLARGLDAGLAVGAPCSTSKPVLPQHDLRGLAQEPVVLDQQQARGGAAVRAGWLASLCPVRASPAPGSRTRGSSTTNVLPASCFRLAPDAPVHAADDQLHHVEAEPRALGLERPRVAARGRTSRTAVPARPPGCRSRCPARSSAPRARRSRRAR